MAYRCAMAWSNGLPCGLRNTTGLPAGTCLRAASMADA